MSYYVWNWYKSLCAGAGGCGGWLKPIIVFSLDQAEQQSQTGSLESEICQNMKHWMENQVFLQDRCITNVFKVKIGLSKSNL